MRILKAGRSLLLTCVTGAGVLAFLGSAAIVVRQLHAAAEPEATPSLNPARLDQRFAADVRPLLEKHCYECHGNGKHKGKIALDKLPSVADLRADRKTLQKMAD